MKKMLLVVAHPDDEAIFATGLILRNPKIEWHVICVTDGNAWGQKTRRAREFARSCRLLGVKRSEILGFADDSSRRLPVDDIVVRLKSATEGNSYAAIYTHNVFGEYGNPHHQDVSYAVHQAFAKVYSFAWTCRPEVAIALKPRELALKQKILETIYAREFALHGLALMNSWAEGLFTMTRSENGKLYRAIVQKTGRLDSKCPKRYRGFIAAARHAAQLCFRG